MTASAAAGAEGRVLMSVFVRCMCECSVWQCEGAALQRARLSEGSRIKTKTVCWVCAPHPPAKQSQHHHRKCATVGNVRRRLCPSSVLCLNAASFAVRCCWRARRRRTLLRCSRRPLPPPAATRSLLHSNTDSLPPSLSTRTHSLAAMSAPALPKEMRAVVVEAKGGQTREQHRHKALDATAETEEQRRREQPPSNSALTHSSVAHSSSSPLRPCDIFALSLHRCFFLCAVSAVPSSALSSLLFSAPPFLLPLSSLSLLCRRFQSDDSSRADCR